jgi:transposase
LVPAEPMRQVRNLARARFDLVEDRARVKQRVEKLLEDALIKISSVLTDIHGVSGRAMIEALIAGETDPAALAALARRLKAPNDKLRAALQGRVTRHHRFLMRLHLNQIDALDIAIATIDREVDAQAAPFRTAIRLLSSIPGIGELGARVIVSEIGTDMARFPTAGHLLSWAGLCPRNDESAGKRRSTRLRHGAPWLKTTLVQCAWAATRKKGSYLQAQFHRLRARRGAKKAICAVAASMLTAAYHMIQRDQDFRDLGAGYFDQFDRQKLARRLVRRLQDLGLEVDVRSQAA